ncbi:MAG TPA: CoA-binding protein [Bacteroidales bacterium]|nr:CoA-binding protein [Bacteroidales bacterium]
MEKKTLVLGASDNPSRFAYKAIRSLQRRDIPIVAIGRKDIDLNGIKIRKGKPADVKGIHTVSLYMNSSLQREYYDYILSLNPSRIIFNPGTRNPELAEIAIGRGIEAVDDCMLVMLNTGRF